MRTLHLRRCCHDGPRQEMPGWLQAVEREVSQGWRSGSSRQSVVARVAQEMYRRDLHDLGPVLDLGLFSWEMYIGDAELMVDWLLQGKPWTALRAEDDRSRS